MLEINLENFENQKLYFRELLGEDFIAEAEKYTELISNLNLLTQQKNYNPFFDFWHTYNLDIKNSHQQNKLFIIKF